MDDLEIEAGEWAAEADGGLAAPYRVAVGGHPTQAVAVAIDAATVADLGLPLDDGLVDVAPRIDERARAALEHLAGTGRIATDLRLSPFDLAGVLEDEHPPLDEGDPVEPGPEA